MYDMQGIPETEATAEAAPPSAAEAARAEESAPEAPGNLLTRDDTFLGICEGLGEDLGFNPLWLRLALTLFLFMNPLGALALYAALGVLVLATRLVAPAPRSAPGAAPAPAADEARPALPLAA